jgi:hypothetical protein
MPQENKFVYQDVIVRSGLLLGRKARYLEQRSVQILHTRGDVVTFFATHWSFESETLPQAAAPYFYFFG